MPLPSMTDIISSLNFAGFVNAQYRFVMNPTGDYTVHFADPDMCVSISTLLSDGNR